MKITIDGENIEVIHKKTEGHPAFIGPLPSGWEEKDVILIKVEKKHD